jgi:HEPN domain-containing protein
MTRQEIIDFWKQSSDKDFLTMIHLYESGDYIWSLFIGHLVIEKLLKAYYVRNVGVDYPLIHNLLRIAAKAGLDLTEEQQEFFSTVTGFNINARYDDYKQSFYKKCTPEFTLIWIEKIKEYRKWIKEQL